MVLAVLALVLGAAPQVSSPEQLFSEAVAAQQRGDDALAVRKYGELLKLRPDVLEARANLGAALARLGRYDEAIEQYRAALAESQGNAALRLNLALAYYKKGDLPGAVKELSPLHDAQPGDVRIATLLGDCYARLGQDDRVIALLTPVEAAHPEDLGVAWVLGSALIRAGRAPDGLKRVEMVARRGHSPEACLLAGQTLLKMSEFERARDLADAAMRLNPKLPGLLTLRGAVLQYLGDNPGAIAALRQALEANPNDFDAHLTLGAVLNTERDLEGARLHLERAVALDPASTLARYELARLERTQGQLEAAVKDFERVVRDDPDWPQPHLDLATLYFRLQRTEEGQRERAIFDRLSAGKQKR
ncbi:MAG: tetratricopeptide repeat protein [Bryobacteraceae bacterium]|jgi:tetratricopeptide (TPR) repeat protein